MKRKKAVAQIEGGNVDAILEKWEDIQYWKKRMKEHKKREERWRTQAQSYRGNNPKIIKIIKKLQGSIV